MGHVKEKELSGCRFTICSAVRIESVRVQSHHEGRHGLSLL